jgi:hypothetical protein
MNSFFSYKLSNSLKPRSKKNPNKILSSKTNNIYKNQNNKKSKTNRKSNIKTVTNIKNKCGDLINKPNLDCFRQNRNYEDYSEFHQSIINDISIWGNEKNGQLPSIVGTFSNKIFYYPGDIDMMQTINFDEKSWNNLKNKNLGEILETKFRYVIDKVEFDWPQTIFIDFKAGFSEIFYPIYLNFLNNPYSYDRYKKSLQNIPVEKKIVIKKLISILPQKDNDNKFKLFMCELFRILGILRWPVKAFETHGDITLKWPNSGIIQKAIDLMKNFHDTFKNLKISDFPFKKETIYLKDVLVNPNNSRIKLDVYKWDPITSQYLEVTNVYIFTLTNGSNEPKFLTENFDDYAVNIHSDFYKYLKKKNLLKCTKRLFNLSKHPAVDKTVSRKVLKFSQIHQTWIARLSQIHGTIEVLIDIFMKQANINRPLDKKHMLSKHNLFNNIPKQNDNLFKKIGDFTTLKNFGKYVMLCHLNQQLGNYIPYIYAILRSWIVFDRNSVFLKESLLTKSDLINDNILYEMEQLENNFNKNTSKLSFFDRDESKIVTKELTYHEIKHHIADELVIWDALDTRSFFDDLLPKRYNGSLKDKKLLLENNWVFYDDNFWINSFKFFIEFNSLLTNFINSQTKVYFEKKIGISDPVKHLVTIRNELDKNNITRDELIKRNYLTLENIKNIENTQL